jgi:hypothetical protein
MTFVHVGAALILIAHAMFLRASLPSECCFEKLLTVGGTLLVGGIIGIFCLA